MRQSTIQICLFCLVTLVFFASCNLSQLSITARRFELTHYKNYYLAGITTQKLWPTRLKFYNDSVLAFSDIRKQRLYFYNMNADSIFIRDILFRDYPVYISQFNFMGRDTLIFASTESSLNELHDSVLLLYDMKNDKILDAFNFNGTQLITSSSASQIDRYQRDFTFPLMFELCLSPEGEVLMPVMHSGYYCCDKGRKEITSTNLYAVYSNKKKKAPRYLPVSFDCSGSDTGSYYPFLQMMLTGCVNSNGDYSMAFGKSNAIWRLNRKTGEVKKINSQPYFLPETKPINDNINAKYDRLDWDLRQIDYQHLVYDSFRNRYLRLVRMPVRSDDPPIMKNFPVWGVIIMDENLKVTGFAELPFGFSTPIIPSKQGIIALDYYASDRGDVCKLVEFKLSEGEPIADSILTHRATTHLINETGMAPYLKSVDTGLLSYKKLIIIPINNSCHSCLETVSTYLKSDLGKDTTVAKLFIASKEEFHQYKEVNHLESNSSYYYDFQSTYKHYLEKLYNINTLLWNGQSFVQKRYSPDALQFLLWDLGLSSEIMRVEGKQCIDCK